MTREAKVINGILNSKDIIYPHQIFRGLNLTEDDFLSLSEIFEINRQETIKKFIHIRNIGNSIIQKDGFLQGIYYSELERPELTLLFKNNLPVDWHKKEHEAKNRDAKTETDVKNSEVIIALNEEKRAYEEKNKDILEQIDGFDLSQQIRTTKNGTITTEKNDEYDNIYPACVINEEILDYLLGAANLGSDLDIALVKNYLDELKQFKKAIEDGIFYSDFNTVDYTGNLSVKSKHTNFIALKPNNSLKIPSSFGEIIVYFNSLKDWRSLSLNYTASTNSYNISSSFKNDIRIPHRGFVHKALLPTPYQKKLK